MAITYSDIKQRFVTLLIEEVSSIGPISNPLSERWWRDVRFTDRLPYLDDAIYNAIEDALTELDGQEGISFIDIANTIHGESHSFYEDASHLIFHQHVDEQTRHREVIHQTLLQESYTFIFQ
jgi:hypothetical protein